jgi:hypothetical protein
MLLLLSVVRTGYGKFCVGNLIVWGRHLYKRLFTSIEEHEKNRYSRVEWIRL